MPATVYNMNSDINFTQLTQENMIARGTFGEIYKIHSKELGDSVVVKRVLQDKRYKNRELQILQMLSHPNMVEFMDYTYIAERGETYLLLVMEYLPKTLGEQIREHKKRGTYFELKTIKLLSYCLLRGLAYLHAQNICHRDVRPDNLLLNFGCDDLKVCDFGSAKILSNEEGNISYVCSRFYRAPELIFGATDYTTAIDVWGAACTIAEMMTLDIAFRGENSGSQLIEIIKVLGTPSRSDINAMNSHYAQYKFPHVTATPLTHIFTPEVAKFLSIFFVYDPKKRTTALDALKHEFFDELRERDTGEYLPHLFRWTDQECNLHPEETLQRITPQWLNANGEEDN